MIAEGLCLGLELVFVVGKEAENKNIAHVGFAYPCPFDPDTGSWLWLRVNQQYYHFTEPHLHVSKNCSWFQCVQQQQQKRKRGRGVSWNSLILGHTSKLQETKEEMKKTCVNCKPQQKYIFLWLICCFCLCPFLMVGNFQQSRNKNPRKWRKTC